MASDAVVLTFSPAVRVQEAPGEDLQFVAGGRTVVLPAVTPGVRSALGKLSAGGGTEGQLVATILELDGISGLAYWWYCLRHLYRLGAVRYVARDGVGTVAAFEPCTEAFDLQLRVIDPDQAFSLSRFAYVRSRAGHLVLESPLSCGAMELLDSRALLLVGALQQCRTARQLAALVPDLSQDTAQGLMSVLASARMLSSATPDGVSTEDADALLAGWGFSDLAFHASTRLRRESPLGGSTPEASPVDPLPALKPSMSAVGVELWRPPVASGRRSEPSLTRVLEGRRSIRTYGRAALSKRQLGEFLYRTAGVRSITRGAQTGPLGAITRRPYPSGGACYGLELYLVIGRCRGLTAGLYHYDPVAHWLEALSVPAEATKRLLMDAGLAMGGRQPPQVLIVTTARFQRVNWKYRSVAYALILKEVGALMQTMYLVATAMDLAPCALGGGDGDLFARLISAAVYEETSVGEFALGARRGSSPR